VLRVGDRRAAQRRHARLLQAAARDRQALDTAEGEDVPQDVPGPVGRGWEDDDVRLWREDGEWSLQGPDGVIEVHGFGFLATITARNGLNCTDRSSCGRPWPDGRIGRTMRVWEFRGRGRSAGGSQRGSCCWA
jgi:hypothetical protein